MTIQQTAELLTLIEKLSLLTGSAAYGLPNPSDHDRFCTRENHNLIVKAAKSVGCEPAESAEGYSPTTSNVIIQVGGLNVHLFIVKDDEIDVVKATTEMVTAAARIMPTSMMDKPFRVMLFRHIRDTLNMMRQKAPKPVAQ